MSEMVAATDLATALLTSKPNCRGDDRFTTENLSAKEAAECRSICRSCPLFDPCRAYAQATRPAAGIWAGRLYGGRSKNQEEITDV